MLNEPCAQIHCRQFGAAGHYQFYTCYPRDYNESIRTIAGSWDMPEYHFTNVRDWRDTCAVIYGAIIEFFEDNSEDEGVQFILNMDDVYAMMTPYYPVDEENRPNIENSVVTLQ